MLLLLLIVDEGGGGVGWEREGKDERREVWKDKGRPSSEVRSVIRCYM
jgi:hypothetical protein